MAQRKPRRKGRQTANLSERVLDEAVGLAEEVGWDHLRLRRVAERIGAPLAEVQACYRDLDAVADAWFARALAQMLRTAEPEFDDAPAVERLHLVLMRWFEANRGHRRVVGEMIRVKLYPPHPHHWVPLVFHLSRLIQWVRETARLDAPGRCRQVEEVGLTLLFLATLSVWLNDETPDQERTHRFLHGALARADVILARTGSKSRTGSK